MAPKTSQHGSKRGSQRAPQASPLTAALNKFISELNGSTLEQGDIIGSRDTINQLKQCLRTCRRNSTLVETTFIECIVDILDADHSHDICSRLDASIYGILIQIILQAEDCKEGERVFYLLAAALYYDTTAEKAGIYRKKESIGRDCLNLMLDFFTNQKNQHGMRQWVGLAYIQLVKTCEPNMERLGMGPEDQRRSLGTRLFDDPNEIVKLICGQLIRTLVDNGMSRDHLWPVGTAKENYESFPGSTQDNKSWGMRLSDFLDKVWENVSDLPDLAGQVYYAQDVNLKPRLNFGVRGHNMTFALDTEHVTMWACATPDTVRFDQSLEIPLVFLARLTIRSRDGSQDLSALANVHLELGAQEGIFCHLDCVRTVIQQITMVMRIADVGELANELRQLCPELEVDNEFDQNNNKLRPTTKLSQSQSQEPLIFGDAGTQLEEQSLQDVSGAVEAPSIKLTPPTVLGQSESTASSPTNNSEIDFVPMAIKPAIIAKATSIQKRIGVKSKAKAPLVISQKVASIGEGKTLDTGNKGKGKQPAVKHINSHQPPSRSSQEDISKLREVFPTMNDPQLRASLLASDGKLELAAEMIAKSADVAVKVSKKITVASGSRDPKARSGPRPEDVVGSSSKLSVHENGFDWEPFGSPETANMSTPKVKGKGKGKAQEKKSITKPAVPNNGTKKPSKYSLNKSAPSVPKAAIIPKAKGKGKVAIAKIEDEDFSEAAPPKSVPAKKPTKGGRLSKRKSAPELKQQSKEESADPADVFELDFDQPHRVSRGLLPKKPLIPPGAVAAQKSLNWGHKLNNMLGNAVTPDVKETQNTPLIGLTQTSLPRPGDSRFKRKEGAPLGVTETTSADIDLIQDDVTGEISKDVDDPHERPDKMAATSIGSIRKSKESSDQAKKRKVNPDVETPSRKRRSNRVSNGNAERSSIRKNPKEKLAALQEVKGKISPQENKTRHKRAIRERPSVAEDTPAKSSAGKILVDDHLARKQTVIGFGATGPKNQGPASVVKVSGRSSRSVKRSEALAVPVEKVLEQKRKRITALDVEVLDSKTEERPKKRQSLSPAESFAADPEYNSRASESPPLDEYIADNSPLEEQSNQVISSAPLAALPIRNAGPSASNPVLSVSNPVKVDGQSRASKSNSQASRVDENGSPMASSSGLQIDHIGKAEQKLRADPPKSAQNSFHGASDGGIFGRKVVLGSIPKARPCSPTKVLTRYVPHKKTRNGTYEDITTRELVELEKKLPDPFIDNKVRTSSGFTNRLLAGVSKVDEGVCQSSKRSALKVNGNGRIQQKPARFAVDVEKTLVNSENEDPSDLTSGTTFNSSDDGLPEQAQEPNEAWTSALRPHYGKLSDAIHRVADEVVIRLAREEDALGLLTDQYESNGNRMLANISTARNLQKAQIEKELGSKRQHLVEIYNDAKTYVDEVQNNVEKSYMANFEQGWKKQQAGIQKQIDEACQAVKELEY